MKYTIKIIHYLKYIHKEYLYFADYFIIFFILLLFKNSDLNIIDNIIFSLFAFLLLVSAAGIIYNFYILLIMVLFFHNVDNNNIKKIIIFSIISLSSLFISKYINLPITNKTLDTYYFIIIITLIGILLFLILIKVFLYLYNAIKRWRI
jgi:hypothetical protein